MTRPPPGPPARAATPAECALPAWLPHLAAHTWDTELLPLPPDLAAYLAAGDGVWLPAESRAVSFVCSRGLFLPWGCPLTMFLSMFMHCVSQRRAWART